MLVRWRVVEKKFFGLVLDRAFILQYKKSHNASWKDVPIVTKES